MILALFLSLLPWCFLPSLESIGLSVQEKGKIDFQDGRHSGHLEFQIGMTVAIVWSTSDPDASYQVSVQEKKRKIDFQDGLHGGHLGFPIGTISAIFDLQVTQMLPTKFQVNWPFSSGEEVKNRFSRWPPWPPSWISDRKKFSYFLSTSHPDASYTVCY